MDHWFIDGMSAGVSGSNSLVVIRASACLKQQQNQELIWADQNNKALCLLVGAG